MVDTKGILRSLTAISGAVIFILGLIGIELTQMDYQSIVKNVDDIMQAILGLVVIFGRIRAKSQIRGMF